MNQISIAPWFLAALLLGASCEVVAQSPAGARQGTLTDGATSNPLRVYGDARQFEAEIKDGFVHCTLKMAKPLIEGMFTCCELRIDCDDNPETGEAGSEMRVRGVVGSRFQPNAAEPTNGSMKPINHVRVSQSNRLKNVRGGWYWINSEIEGKPPVIEGDTMRFSFVVARVREFGDRYKSSFSFRVRVDTSCSDQPLERLHSCADEGLPIVVDGKAEEWSGHVTRDRGDELHPHVRCIDLTGLRVDHSAERVFATVSLADPGLATWRQDGDVEGMPVVSFYLEPMFPRYQNPVERLVRGGSATNGTADSPFHAVVGEKDIEVSFARKTGQGRYRVLVRSDVELKDHFEETIRLDPEAK